MSKRKPFVIRDFNPQAEGYFGSTGVIDTRQTFNEIVRENFDEAVDAVTASPLNTVNSGNPTLDVINFKVGTAITSKDDLRAYRTGIRETIKRWSEKSRIKGTRGWRANAIKTPTFKRNDSTGTYDLKFDVILGRRINYSSAQSVVESHSTFTEVYADIESLKDRLAVVTSGMLRGFKYKHSRFGKGEVV